MKPLISVCAENIDREAGTGSVVYEIEYPDGTFSYMRQPFRKGNYGDGVWGWDGEYPLTLTPSFVCDDPLKNVRVHLFLRGGEIELCSDSTVAVEPARP